MAQMTNIKIFLVLHIIISVSPASNQDSLVRMPNQKPETVAFLWNKGLQQLYTNPGLHGQY